MTTTTVWTAGQKPQRVREAVRVLSALQFHYRRVVFGPQHGMTKAVSWR